MVIIARILGAVHLVIAIFGVIRVGMVATGEAVGGVLPALIAAAIFIATATFLFMVAGRLAEFPPTPRRRYRTITERLEENEKGDKSGEQGERRA